MRDTYIATMHRGKRPSCVRTGRTAAHRSTLRHAYCTRLWPVSIEWLILDPDGIDVTPTILLKMAISVPPEYRSCVSGDKLRFFFTPLERNC